MTILAILLVLWKLDNPKASAPSEDEDSKHPISKVRRIDFMGSASLALAIVGFLLVLDLGGQRLPWSHPVIWIMFATSIIFSIVFLIIEAYVAREPIFPLRLLRQRDVITAYSINFLIMGAQFGVRLEGRKC